MTLLIVLPVLVAAGAAIILYYAISNYVISQAKEHVKYVLLSNRGFHQYIQKNMHPAYYAALEKGYIKKEFYNPAMLSSSYIVRVMHGYDNEEREKVGMPKIYYKLAAHNPRNPVNKADEKETSLIMMFDSDRTVKEHEEIVSEDGQKYLEYAIPFLVNGKACMKCHGRRTEAPPGLQALYNGEGGFNERPGEIRAIESIRIPIDQQVYSAYLLTGSLTSGVAALFLLLIFNTRLRNVVKDKTSSLQDEIMVRKAAEEKLIGSLREKEVLLREVHHRVKNNMAVISSLLNMQSGYVKDDRYLGMFKESQGRIRAMALVHEMLYQSDDLALIDVRAYLESLANSVKRMFAEESRVKILIEVDEITLGLDSLIPCGLIINELLTNALKHSFVDSQGEPQIRLSMKLQGDIIALTVSDNGRGLPEGFDLGGSQKLGLKLVEALVSQIDGTLRINRDHGASFQVTFPAGTESATG